MRSHPRTWICRMLAAWALGSASLPAMAAPPSADARLPTGLKLDPAGASFELGNFPIQLIPSPDGRRLVALLAGWREQGVQVIDRESGQVLQTLPQESAFLGLAFSRDGRTLYASGGNQDALYRYTWQDGAARPATLAGTFPLAEKDPKKDGTRYPAGIALSPDGRSLYVAENLADTLAVLDAATGRVRERLPTGHYPYAVAVTPRGTVFVSAWGAERVDVFKPGKAGRLRWVGAVAAGRHPGALLSNAAGTRLFAASASTDRITVIDTERRRVVTTLLDPPPAGPGEGSTPNALALSPDGTRLYVAEADSNAVAVFELSPRTAGVKGGAEARRDRLAGRIPVEWYPTAVLAGKDGLQVLNGKGHGPRPNPGMAQPSTRLADDSRDYALGQIAGSLTTIPRAELADLAGLTARVVRANGWDRPRTAAAYPPFEHVIYIIKENRTYDQVFADLPGGDGDPSLLFFPREVSPNHHALAERFGLFDRFLVNAEVSAQGHIWSTAAYVTDYTEKTTPSLYASKRAERDEGEVDEPASGYLWTLALKKGIPFRVYGELAQPDPRSKAGHLTYRSGKRELRPYTHPEYPPFDMAIPDQRRADVWLAEFAEHVRTGSLPALEILHLPSDHTAGARAGVPTPRAYMADNDLALGRIVEALSHSPFWKSTVVFVLEDDAQAGPDHIDSHRSVLLTISPYNRAGVIHRFVNTTDVLATIEEILGLDTLSQFDHFGRPLRDLFARKADLTPYDALRPGVPLDEKNPAGTKAAALSTRLDLHREDAADDDLFNRILWRAIKGEDVPYPEPRTLPVKDFVVGR